MNVVFAGPDSEGLVDELRAGGADVTLTDGIADRPVLEAAGIHDADMFILTDASQATSVVVAKEINSDLRVVAYTDDSLPEFVSGQELFAMDPALLGPDALAEELLH